MNRLARLFLVALVSTLASCSTTLSPKQTKGSAPSDNNALALEQEANAALQRWDSRYQVQDIEQAYELYKEIYQQRPDDVNIQRQYYNSSILMSSLGSGPSKAENATLFSKLNPLVKAVVASPGRLAYLEAVGKHESTEQLVDHLKNAIVQHPTDAFAWYEYSTLMEKEKNRGFAVALAQQAYALNPESDKYAFQLADTLNDVIQSQACRYDQDELAKKAVTYYAKASTLRPNEQLYLDNIALQYLRLGVIPIAYSEAKKAFELEHNIWTAKHYAISALLLKKFDEARLATDLLINKLDSSEGYSLAALISASQGDWSQAQADYERYNRDNKLSLYQHIFRQWLLAIANNLDAFDVSKLKANNAWEASILNYLQDATSPMDSLIQIPDDTCRKTEAHFFTAMRYWFAGDKFNSKKHLLETRRQGATLYSEYLWASVMSASLL